MVFDLFMYAVAIVGVLCFYGEARRPRSESQVETVDVLGVCDEPTSSASDDGDWSGLASASIRTLKACASKQRIKNYSRMTKAMLLDALSPELEFIG